jgi:hypothetical protein
MSDCQIIPFPKGVRSVARPDNEKGTLLEQLRRADAILFPGPQPPTLQTPRLFLVPLFPED